VAELNLMQSLVLKLKQAAVSGQYPALNKVKQIGTRVKQAKDSADARQFPYIAIRDLTSQPLDTGTKNGLITSVSIYVFSRYDGVEEALKLGDEIYTVLHGRDLVIAGREQIAMARDRHFIADEPDGLTRRGVSTYLITHRA
jgi:hypothetical protein